MAPLRAKPFPHRPERIPALVTHLPEGNFEQQKEQFIDLVAAILVSHVRNTQREVLK